MHNSKQLLVRLVGVSSCSCQLVFGAPFVTENCTSQPHMLGDKGKQGCSISLLHLHQKALSAASLNLTKHPVFIHNSATVVFSLPKFAFIDFNFCPWPANHQQDEPESVFTDHMWMSHRITSMGRGETFLQPFLGHLHAYTLDIPSFGQDASLFCTSKGYTTGTGIAAAAIAIQVDPTESQNRKVQISYP
ncbi:hypothetical protein EMCRGX_G011737 [Ephydatia muelleri]